VIGEAAVGEVDGEVAVVCREIGEVAADHLAAVAGAEDEPAKPEPGVPIHDVQEHRPLADIEHGLGAQGRSLAQT
jgi:hypothetical protein